jgi:hypothetical protein
MRRNRLIRLLLILLATGAAECVHAADWLQFGYDQAHSGFNPTETSYPVAAQTAAQWSVTIHAVGSGTGLVSDAAPVYLSNVTTPGGIKNVLYVVTTNGTLVALDAANGTVLWSRQPSSAQTNEGTSGSPAVDPGRQYVYAYALDGYVYRYNVGDGTPANGNGWPELSTRKPNAEKGAAALAFSTPVGGTNYLYHVTNGYNGDGGDYQGHITAINLATGAQNVFNVMCSNLLNVHFVNNGTPRTDDCNLTHSGGYGDGQMGGIWGRPGTIYDAQTNRIYFASGNGLFDANTAGDYEWGDSVLAMNPDGTGAGMGMPIDSYTPSNFAGLYGGDTDLGSTSPAILPSTSAQYPHLAIQSGKDSCVRLINLDNMSGAGGPGHAGGELNAASSCSTDALGTHVVFPQPAVWINPADHSTWVYVVNHSDKIQAYQLNLASNPPSLAKKWSGAAGRSPVIADHTLYYVSGSAVVGRDTVTGTQVWSASIGGVHWQSPIIIDHHLYVADNGTKLWSFAIDGIFKNGLE